MKGLLFGFGIAACAVSAHAVTIYDALNQTMQISNATTSWDGGNAVWGTNYGIQLGQRVTGVAGGSIVTQVAARFVTYHDAIGIDSALVEVFNISGDTAGSLVGQASGMPTITHVATSGNFFIDDISLNVSVPGLLVGNEYLVVIQPHSTQDYGGVLYTNTAAHESFIRDYSSYGYSGRVGHGDFQWTNGHDSMLVVGVPEPSSLIAIGAAICLLAKRKKK